MTSQNRHQNPWEYAAASFEPQTDYVAFPHLWAEERLQEFWWSKQREIADSLRDHRYTAVMSCHDAGKSYIASRLAAKWIDQHPEGDAFIVSTAPTTAQVSAILWREITRAHKRGNLTGKIVASGYPTWKLDDGEIIGYGRKPADHDQAAFQGIHADFVLVLVDEAGGVDAKLFNAVDSLVTNEFARVLAIGNPDDPTGHFAEICKPDSGWNVIQIDGLRTPKMTKEQVEGLDCVQCRKAGRYTTLLQQLFREEQIPYSTEEIPEDLQPRLLSPIWVEERLHRWVGRPSSTQSISQMAAQSALFTAKVRGRFPTSSSEGVIPLGWVEAAMARHRDWVDAGSPPPLGSVRIGADIAGKGEDETAFALRIGDVTLEIRKHHHADTMEVAGLLLAAMRPYVEREVIAIIDAIGIGAGVLDRLREQDWPVYGFTASNAATNLKDRSGEFGFQNLRAAAWWNMREMLDPSRGSTLLLPDDEMLKADLTSPRWKVLSGGKIQVESKDDIRSRLGRSTDSGDAVVQAHWLDAGTSLGEPDTVSWWDGLSPEEVVSWGVEGMAELDEMGFHLKEHEGW